MSVENSLRAELYALKEEAKYRLLENKDEIKTLWIIVFILCGAIVFLTSMLVGILWGLV